MIFGATLFGVTTATAAQFGPHKAQLIFTDHPVSSKEIISVTSMNAAHCSGALGHQVFRTKRAIVKQVRRIAASLKADVILLQEVDSPSWWTKGVDQMSELAHRAGFSSFVRGNHVQGVGLQYGTSILSRVETQNAQTFNFKPSFPTTPKGFSRVEVKLGERYVDVVSLHLDFARAKIRRRQIRSLINELKKSENPLIIGGDFNTDWKRESSALHILSKELNVYTVEPESIDPGFFSRSDKRIDWIFISRDLVFDSYSTDVNSKLSDHVPVTAEIRFRN